MGRWTVSQHAAFATQLYGTDDRVGEGYTLLAVKATPGAQRPLVVPPVLRSQGLGKELGCFPSKAGGLREGGVQRRHGVCGA